MRQKLFPVIFIVFILLIWKYVYWPYERIRYVGKMVFVEGGCFKMGDAFGEGNSDEIPLHEVCVSDFHIGQHEVTQGHWAKVMGYNPAFYKDCGDNCPVEQISWKDVHGFIKKLNKKTGLNYRLPTEAEWEYAAREKGSKVRFGTGKNTIGVDEANFDGSSKYKEPFSFSGDTKNETVPVKSFLPNFLGLYNMSGNIWEWVSDCYDKEYYKKSPRNNPECHSGSKYRVLRGGSWISGPWYLRVSHRLKFYEEFRNILVGFRLVFSSPSG